MKKVNLLDQCSNFMEPCDYDKFIQKLYDMDAPKFVRKIKACKFIAQRYFEQKLNMYNYSLCEMDSKEFFRKDSLQYVEELMLYDIVSFDMFDTLILRKIIDSSDVYYLVGLKLQVKDFKKIRKYAEEEARKRFSSDNGYDVNLRDIYTVLHEWYDIDIEVGMNVELEVEKALCVANPYWYPVFQELIRRGKRVIISTDMYFSEQDLRSILESNGYIGQEKIYVSCELHVSKRNGQMFEFIQNDLGNDNLYVHIGDHEIFDYKMAQVKGWKSIYYMNVHLVGKLYRRCGINIVDSISYGILDVALHNGVMKYESLEKYGFSHLGRAYVEFFKQLDQFVVEKKVDKVLFIQSDGEFLCSSYRKFFGNICSDNIDLGGIKLDLFMDGYENIKVILEKYLSGVVYNCERVCIVDIDRNGYVQKVLEILNDCIKWHGTVFVAPYIDDMICQFWREINRNDEIMIKICKGVLEYMEEYYNLEKRLGLRVYIAAERILVNKS